MIINPLQIGPCTLDEAAELLKTLESAVTERGTAPVDRDEAAAILEGRAKALGESRELHSLSAQRHAMIMAAFEGPKALPQLSNPFKCIVARYAMDEPESLELKYSSPINEFVMEYIALYLPRAYYGDRYGIYLHAYRILDLAKRVKQAGLDLAGGITPAVGVHEVFHAFVEEAMSIEDYTAHCETHADSYCLWEEAAANRATADWCQDPQSSAGASQAARDELIKTLLPTRAQGGPPGYGDWQQVDRDYAAVVPCALSRKSCATAINAIDWTIAVGDILTSSEAERLATIRLLDLWIGMKARFLTPGERVVPVYLDLVPWGR